MRTISDFIHCRLQDAARSEWRGGLLQAKTPTANAIGVLSCLETQRLNKLNPTSKSWTRYAPPTGRR